LTDIIGGTKMSTKKNPEADLEQKRGLFFQIGLIVSLLVALLAFNIEMPQTRTETVVVKVLGLEICSPQKTTPPKVDNNIDTLPHSKKN